MDIKKQQNIYYLSMNQEVNSNKKKNNQLY